METLRNIAILAHVDAGKTTLSERILFTASEIRRPGDVEDGLATMDYLVEEKNRGITIEAGIAHFVWRKIWFNFIDTPGHIDFGAEVDSALSAAESAVLVVSASSGVETQTLTAWRKLQAHALRTFVFINKLDNPDYSLDDTLLSIEESFNVRPILLSIPEYQNGELVSVLDVLSKTRLIHNEDGREIPEKFLPGEEPEILKKIYAEAVDFASNIDDEVLEKALSNEEVSPQLLIQALEKLVASGKYILCYAGSAKKNFSVRSLMTSLTFFAAPCPALNNSELGLVFRLRYFHHEGEVALFRAHTGLKKENFPEGFEFFRMRGNLLLPAMEIRQGDIYALKAKRVLELGEVISLQGEKLRCALDLSGHYQPVLQTRLECLAEEDFTKTKNAIASLLRTDPSFKIDYKEETGNWIVYTVGEVQLEVLLSRLEREFKCKVSAGMPEVTYQERLKEPIKNFFNKCCLGPFEASVEFSAEDKGDFSNNEILILGCPEIDLPIVSDALQELAGEGVVGKGKLCGSRFKLEFLNVSENAPLSVLQKVCTDAFKLAILPKKISVYEPIMEVFAESPANYAGALTGDIHFRQGKVLSISGDGNIHSFYAEVPLKNLFGYATAVRSISRGTAIYSMRFLEYREIKD